MAKANRRARDLQEVTHCQAYDLVHPHRRYASIEMRELAFAVVTRHGYGPGSRTLDTVAL